MFDRRSLSFAVALSLCAGGGQAFAAEPLARIKALTGDALVSKGEHFVTASQGMDLQQLDRVVVLEQGKATIEFEDGCQYPMKENELLTVGSQSTCKAKQADSADYAAVQQTATSQIRAGTPAGAAILNTGNSGAVYGPGGTGVGGAGASGGGTVGAGGVGGGVGAAGTGAGGGLFGGATFAGLNSTTGGLLAIGGLGVAGGVAAGSSANGTKSTYVYSPAPISGE